MINRKGGFAMKQINNIFKISLFILLLALLLPLQSLAKSSIIETISPRQVADLISQRNGDPNFIILDIRTHAEFKTGHLHNAVLLDYYSKTFVNELKRLDKTKTYLIYCRSGNRSGRSLGLIKEMGFQSVYNMDQGIIRWLKKGYKITK
jgi:rhodanese-related sulfurtransferase